MAIPLVDPVGASTAVTAIAAAPVGPSAAALHQAAVAGAAASAKASKAAKASAGSDASAASATAAANTTAAATAALATTVVSELSFANADGSITTVTTYGDGHTESQTTAASQAGSTPQNAPAPAADVTQTPGGQAAAAAAQAPVTAVNLVT